jgi:phage terminase small subunit
MSMADAKELKPLSRKHQRFVAEYLKCFNGTRAYMAVYKKASPETARANAAKLLANTSITKVIDDEKNMVLMQADEAMKLQTDIANGDMADFINSFGGVDWETAKEKGLTKLVKKWKVKTVTINGKEEDKQITTEELELYPADVAQERILKISGKLVNRVEGTGEGGAFEHKVTIYMPDNKRQDVSNGS